MKTAPINVVRQREHILSDDERVIARYFSFDRERTRAILGRLLSIPEAQVEPLLNEAREAFGWRHRDLDRIFRGNCREVVGLVETPQTLSEQRKLLIGAYFSMEYAIHAAALFNPSMVIHPDQSDIPAGALRFLMSLRATGEGHVSSIVFRQGMIDTAGRVTLDPPPQFADWARPTPRPQYDKRRFMRKLLRLQPQLALIRKVLDPLPDPFTLDELDAVIKQIQDTPGTPAAFALVAHDIFWLASAHYSLEFPAENLPGETVIFPATEHESRGLEDLRLVRFHDDDGQIRYCGTYTAFDGSQSLPMMLETRDFRAYQVYPISGEYARNKGMALFPRKVGGRYLMVSRHDGESLYLLDSDDLYFWDEAKLIQGPVENWEMIQIGNCGSPIETDAGWLLLTHGVGPVRQYVIGALLLDRDDPARVLGRLRDPLLIPTAAEREGYVPNVVYSCGSLVHAGQLIIPYAVSDLATTFANVRLAELIDCLRASGP